MAHGIAVGIDEIEKLKAWSALGPFERIALGIVRLS